MPAPASQALRRLQRSDSFGDSDDDAPDVGRMPSGGTSRTKQASAGSRTHAASGPQTSGGSGPSTGPRPPGGSGPGTSTTGSHDADDWSSVQQWRPTRAAGRQRANSGGKKPQPARATQRTGGWGRLVFESTGEQVIV
eukprot:TRINITY_DN10331_c4_g1_i1.p2 TRINITY_DN10331_c4_g1~~TRINITY_DN10331_c4_g1_i1.p2  ORF type:complete len:138 (+),score=24.24 TRINITY_DN10331_c4_g1_i1:90-503(+)